MRKANVAREVWPWYATLNIENWRHVRKVCWVSIWTELAQRKKKTKHGLMNEEIFSKLDHTWRGSVERRTPTKTSALVHMHSYVLLTSIAPPTCSRLQRSSWKISFFSKLLSLFLGLMKSTFEFLQYFLTIYSSIVFWSVENNHCACRALTWARRGK